MNDELIIDALRSFISQVSGNFWHSCLFIWAAVYLKTTTVVFKLLSHNGFLSLEEEENKLSYQFKSNRKTNEMMYLFLSVYKVVSTILIF